MITSSQINQLSEEYLKTVKSYSNSFPVFENPSAKEIAEACKQSKVMWGESGIRFFADNSSKKVYIWDSYYGVHIAIARQIGLGDRCINHDPTLFFGSAKVIGGKAVIEDSDELRAEQGNTAGRYQDIRDKGELFFKKFFAINWSWVDKYVSCSAYLNKIKDLIK